MFARKALFSSLGRAAMVATVAAVALTAVEPSLARAGSAGKGLRRPGRACRRRPVPATRLTSAPGVAITGAAVAPPRQPPLPALSAPGLRLPPPRTVATTITTAAHLPITVAVRPITAGTPITAVSRIMAADMVIAGPTSPISTVIRPPAGNRGHPEPFNPPAA